MSHYILAVLYEGMPTLNNGWQPKFLPLPFPIDTHYTFFKQWQRLVAILRAGWREKLLVLDSTAGSLHPDLLATVLMGFWPQRKRPMVVMMGDMWQPNEGFRHVLEKVLMQLANRVIDRYVVQSSEEVEIFPALWGVPAEKIRRCLYFYTFLENEIAQPAPPQNYIFAGGNPHRDYETLLEVARRMPDQPFIFATKRLQNHPNIPPNVTAKPVSHDEFVRLMAGAALVVTPVKGGLKRAVGQQTYLNAMRLGKVSIVNNTQVMGVHDHIQHGVNGLLVNGDIESYVAAIHWAFDPANREAVAKMQRQAVETACQFSYEQHIACLGGIIEELLLDAQLDLS